MGFFLVMKAEIVRTFIIMRRYWFATLTGLAIGYAMLIGLLYGFMYNRAIIEQWAEKATTGALGLVIGMFAFGIVGLFTQTLQGMARTGELEQLCMSPHGLITNFLARSLVGAVTSVLTLTIMLYLIAISVKGTLHADPGPTSVLLALTFINLLGFGFMAGGLVLVFKQTGQVAMLVRMGLLALAIAASENVRNWPVFARWLAHAFPVTDAAICLKYVLVQGQQDPKLNAAGEKVVKEIVAVVDKAGAPVLDDAGRQVMKTIYDTAFSSVFQHESFFFLVVSCVVWTTIGVICFRYMENWSRDKGTLGSY